MASFPQNLKDMVAKPRSIRGVAELAGIDEKTIRNWLNKQDPSGNLKARKFLEAVKLPWPDALGDYDLTPEWWAGFRARFEDTPQQRAVAYIKAGEWEKMTPEQQAAVQGVVAAFEALPSKSEIEVKAKPSRPRRAG